MPLVKLIVHEGFWNESKPKRYNKCTKVQVLSIPLTWWCGWQGFHGLPLAHGFLGVVPWPLEGLEPCEPGLPLVEVVVWQPQTLLPLRWNSRRKPLPHQQPLKVQQVDLRKKEHLRLCWCWTWCWWGPWRSARALAGRRSTLCIFTYDLLLQVIWPKYTSKTQENNNNNKPSSL